MRVLRMKKYSLSLTNFLNRVGYKKLFIAALLLRLFLAIPFRSGDLENYAIWGIYSRQFGFSGFYDFLSFGNYARPDYPPLAMILFWFVRLVWEVLFSIFWRINILLPAFPSNFITWFDHEGFLFLLKLPGLVADFAIGVVLFKYIKEKFDKNKALLAASLYWFNPATIYVSSMWGQVDGLVIFFALLSLISLEKKKSVLGLSFFVVSILVKPTMLMVAPIVIYFIYKNRIKFVEIFKSVTISLSLSLLVASFFAPGGITNSANWLFNNYINRFIPAGAMVLPYIQVRAFNFWTLVTGSDFTKDTQFWNGVTLFWWALVLSAIVVCLILFRLIKRGNPWLAAVLLVMATFLFLPRVHERYLQPAIALLIPVVIRYPKLLWIFFVVVLLHFFNLYAAWQVPYSSIAAFLFSDIPARVISFCFIATFIYLVKNYGSQKIW